MDDFFVAHNENNLVVLSNYLEIKIVGCRRDPSSLISLSCFFMNRLPIVSCRQPKVPLKLDNHDQKYKKKKGCLLYYALWVLRSYLLFFSGLLLFWIYPLDFLILNSNFISGPCLLYSCFVFILWTFDLNTVRYHHIIFFSLLGTVCQWCPTTCRTGATFSHGDSTIISSSSTTTILMPSRTR